jgi:hypothetical protein
MPSAEQCVWRVGRSVGRTIYAIAYYMGDDGDEHEMSWLIGLMDTPELAQAAVEAHNAAVAAAKNQEDSR